MPPGGDSSPSFENAVTIDGYQVISILELVKNKCTALGEKDVSDVLWLCQNRGDDVQATCC